MSWLLYKQMSGVLLTSTMPRSVHRPGSKRRRKRVTALENLRGLLHLGKSYHEIQPIKGRLTPDIQKFAEISNSVYFKTETRLIAAHKLGLQLDLEFETERTLLMYNIHDKKAILCFRGTKLFSPSDIRTDIAIFLGDEINSTMFRSAMLFCQAAIAKYGKRKLTLVGHSLGGTISIYCARQLGLTARAFNPGSAPLTYIRKLWNTLINDSRDLNDAPTKATNVRRGRQTHHIYIYIVKGDWISNFILLDDPSKHKIHIFDATDRHKAHYIGNFIQ